MQKQFFTRRFPFKRKSSLITIHKIDQFAEVEVKNYRNDIEVISGIRFESFHHIIGTNQQTIMTAYRTQDPEFREVLFIVWDDYPFYNHIELGGDFMLQEIQRHGFKYLLIDNTFVKSQWQSSDLLEYFDRAWYPGLIELGIETFVHITAKTVLGSKSFAQFKKDINDYLAQVGDRIQQRPFSYIPVEAASDKTMHRRDVLNNALSIVTNKHQVVL